MTSGISVGIATVQEIPAIVRNLLKQPFYLRVLRNQRDDQNSQTIAIPPQSDIEVSYRDFYEIEQNIIDLQRRKILLIIRYPGAPSAGSIAIQENGTLIKPAVTILNFNRGIIATDGGQNQINVDVALTLVTSFAQLPDQPFPYQPIYAKYDMYDGAFVFDPVRAKWLSQETLTLTWNSDVTSAVTNLQLVSEDDNAHPDNDTPMLSPCTIVGLMGSQANPLAAGNETQFELGTLSLDSSVLSQGVAVATLSTVGSRYINTSTLDVDIPGSVVVSSRRVKLQGTDVVTRPAVKAFYRIRLM